MVEAASDREEESLGSSEYEEYIDRIEEYSKKKLPVIG